MYQNFMFEIEKSNAPPNTILLIHSFILLNNRRVMICVIDLQKDAEAARRKLDDLHIALTMVRKNQTTSDTTIITQHAPTSPLKNEEYALIPTMQIPLQTLRCVNNDAHILLAYLDAEEVKLRLGAQNCTFSVHHSQNEIFFETTHSQYCDLDRDISYDINAFQKMKKENIDTWKLKWGSIEYDRIIQKLIQTMLALDLSLHVKCAELMSSNALSTAMSWSLTESVEIYAFSAVEHAVGDALDREIKVRRCKVPLVDIHVCNHSWADNSYGLGFILSRIFT